MIKKIVLSLIVILVGGCTFNTYNLVEPENFEPSLTPSFKWKPFEGAASYDLAIWDTIYIESQYRYAKGDRIHYAEDISGNEYTLPVKLKADTVYYWSVRPHNTKTWSTRTADYYPGGWERGLFRFRTEGQKNIDWNSANRNIGVNF